jgi:hypothetical protein
VSENHKFVTLVKDRALGTKIPNIMIVTDGEKETYVHKAWIPCRGAVVGKKLRLDVGEEWDEGWIVSSVSDGVISGEEANAMHKRQKTWKEAEVAGRRSYKD